MRKPSGESAAFYCRGRRPDAPAAAPKTRSHVRRIRSRPFLPPAGEGGIRRSPARRMTEEGEPDRLRTVKSFVYPTGFGHFYIAVPPRSPAPVALVGDTLPRWGREWERALWTNGKVRRALQGECGFARRVASVLCCCAERRGRRSLPGVRIRRTFVIISPLLPGRRGRRPLPWGTAAISADIAHLRLFFGASLFCRLTQKCCNCAI